ncbi:MAG: GNAT family N-acetyltransferase [Alphaproteobacteria bacterium]
MADVIKSEWYEHMHNDKASLYKVVSQLRSNLAPLTETRLQDFHDLLLHLARGHASEDQIGQEEHRRGLLKDIVEQKNAEAFLVVSSERAITVAAATYYNSLQGLHLEDLVVTPKTQTIGAGVLAMAGLAQIAVQREAGAVIWECSADNQSALRFYEKLGSVCESDRHTWRLMGPIKTQLSLTDLREQFVLNAHFVAKPVPVVSGHEQPSELHHIQITAQKHDGSAFGEIQASRSYSTFRVVQGMHIEAVVAPAEKPELLAGLIEQAGASQRQFGWHGHTDITVQKGQESSLGPVLERYGFEPLCYGESRMLTFTLSGQALQDLAASPQRNLLAGLNIPAASRPVAQPTVNGTVHLIQ